MQRGGAQSVEAVFRAEQIGRKRGSGRGLRLKSDCHQGDDHRKLFQRHISRVPSRSIMPLLCTDAITQERASPVDPNGAISRVGPPVRTDKLRTSLAHFAVDVVFLYRLLRHPNTRWYARGLLSLPVIYICSPIQFIPNFIPVIGQMDDLFAIWMTKKIARNLVDEKTWQECHCAAVATRLPFQSK